MVLPSPLLNQTCGNAPKQCYCGMRVFFLGGGAVDSQGLGHWSALVCARIVRLCIIYARVIVHTHCIMGHNIQSFFPPPPSESPQSAPPPALSWPTTYSCEERRRAERDICSLRECPNYSWSFNHSGFGLGGICGVSHKCAPATLVNGSFINCCFVFCTFHMITKQ